MKYWQGINNSINTQFSHTLLPFGELQLITKVIHIPLKYRNFNRFRIDLTKKIDIDLAKYQTNYGFNCIDDIKFKTKLKTNLKTAVPISLRPYLRSYIQSRIIKKRQHQSAYYLNEAYLNEIFDSEDMILSQFVNIDKVSDSDMLSRILTVELLMRDSL